MKPVLLTLLLLGPAGISLAQTDQQQCILVRSDGQEMPVRLISVDGALVRYSVAGEEQQISADEVFALRRRGAEVMADQQAREIALRDGSILRASRLTVDDNLFSVVGMSDQKFSLPRSAVRYIKLLPLEDQETGQRWQEIVADPDQAGDWLVFRRNGQMDYLEGLVGRIDETSIEFRRNGQSRQAPRDRIDGVIYFHADQQATAGPIGTLSTVTGDRLAFARVAVEADQIQVTTAGGSEFRCPIEQLVSIELGNRRVRYVSNLEPTSQQWQPLVLNSELVEYQRVLNRPRFDRSFDDQPLQLRFPGDARTNSPPRRITYERGIAAKGGTRLVFDLEGQFVELTGVAGFAPALRTQGQVELVINGDGRELFREVLGKEQRGPREIRVNVADVKRLVLRVDYHDGRSIGDVVHLCDLKVVR